MNRHIKRELEGEIEKYVNKQRYSEETHSKVEYEKNTKVLYFLRHIFLKELNYINLSKEEVIKHFKGLFKFLETEDVETYKELNSLLNNFHSKYKSESK